MFHAVIRAPRGAIHFVGEVEPYCLEALRQYVAGTMRADTPLHLHIGVDPSSRDELLARLGRWMKRLAKSGAEIQVGELPAADRRLSYGP